mmetsp:Transcript_19404/g.29804  ORF Transcript_19404/g.29804 Transcript_19404/m.29804 type:complete len:232 (+) Transcript_19404:242-937(+)
MKDLGDKIHDAELKFGITVSAGVKACKGDGPGSYGYEETDAQDFADWGVDYLKYVDCFNLGTETAEVRFTRMGDALKATDRDVFYAVSTWGGENVIEWGPQVANSWTLSPDLYGVYSKPIGNAWQHMKGNFLQAIAYADKVSAGHYNDLGELLIDTFLSEYYESNANFNLWAFSKSPLFLSGNVGKMSEQTLASFRDEVAINANKNSFQNAVTCHDGCDYSDPVSSFTALY